MTRLSFRQVSRDTQTGCASWDVLLGDQKVGSIEKDTVWCGEGYLTDSYSVTVDVGDEEAGESYQVANVWNRKGMTAREALAACKAFARQAVEIQEAAMRPCSPPPERIPVPFVSSEAMDRNRRRATPDDWDGTECLFCCRPILNRSTAWAVHMTTSLELVPADVPDDDVADSQGGFEIGPECAKKIPARFRSRIGR
jgi:hypothetical protein